MVSHTYVSNEGITTAERLATQWSTPAEASERQRTDVWERPVQTQTASLPAQVNDGTPSGSRTSVILSKCTKSEKGALLCDHHKYKTSHHPPLSNQAVSGNGAHYYALC